MKSFRPHQGLTIMNYETVVYRAARMLFPSPTGGVIMNMSLKKVSVMKLGQVPVHNRDQLFTYKILINTI